MSLTIIKSQYNISKDGQVRKWNLSKYLVVRVLRKRPRGAARGGSAALTSGPDAESQVLNQQRLFSRLLAERSEFVQEAASKGLGLVYDMCSDEVRRARCLRMTSGYVSKK